MDHKEALDTWMALSTEEQRSILASEKMDLEKIDEAESIIFKALDDKGIDDWHAAIRKRDGEWQQWQRDEPAKYALSKELQRSKWDVGYAWEEEIEEAKEAKRLANAEKRKQKKIIKQIAQLQTQLK